MSVTSNGRVLVIGVYLLDQQNHATHISKELIKSDRWNVDLRWCAVGDNRIPENLGQFTKLTKSSLVPKFRLLNELLKDVQLSDYRYVIVTDDDIELQAGFLDRYLSIVEKYDFSLSQPARTHDSFIDHYFVAQLQGVDARRTLFVEIGPFFSISWKAFSAILPFDEEAPMGWGLDVVWPKEIENAGLRMGIVDSTPVSHRLRKPVSCYNYESTNADMKSFLDRNDHIEFEDAYVAIETYPCSGEGDFDTSLTRAETVISDEGRGQAKPFITALICTHNRAPLLRKALTALCGQTLASNRYEVVVIDDGSTDETRKVVEDFGSLIPIRYAFQAHSGLAAAKNHGINLAKGEIVVFLDDDDVVDSSFLEQHCISHKEFHQYNYSVLGYTDLAPGVDKSPLMNYVVKVGCNLFSYPSLNHGDVLDFSYFWGGRSSCKKRILMMQGVFNPVFRFGAEDIELGFRLSRENLRVVYNRNAVSHMVRALDFKGFARRCYQQGRSNWVFSRLHLDPIVQDWTEVSGIDEEWSVVGPHYGDIMKVARDLDCVAQERVRAELPLDELTVLFLHRAYQKAFRAARIKGLIDMKAEHNRSTSSRSDDVGDANNGC